MLPVPFFRSQLERIVGKQSGANMSPVRKLICCLAFTTSFVTAAEGPRPGRYVCMSYGASTPLFLGYLELRGSGEYEYAKKTGKYSYDPAAKSVQWLNGPMKENNWQGVFEIDRDGKTHKIRVTPRTLCSNSTDSGSH